MDGVRAGQGWSSRVHYTSAAVMVEAVLEGAELRNGQKVNRQAFLQLASRTINTMLRSQVLSGIEYEKTAGSVWEIRPVDPGAEEAIE